MPNAFASAKFVQRRLAPLRRKCRHLFCRAPRLHDISTAASKKSHSLLSQTRGEIAEHICNKSTLPYAHSCNDAHTAPCIFDLLLVQPKAQHPDTCVRLFYSMLNNAKPKHLFCNVVGCWRAVRHPISLAHQFHNICQHPPMAMRDVLR